jgi:hypothetical protein
VSPVRSPRIPRRRQRTCGVHVRKRDRYVYVRQRTSARRFQGPAGRHAPLQHHGDHPGVRQAIAADQATISVDQNQVNQANLVVVTWQQKVAKDRVQTTCEAQGVTRFDGCGKGTGWVGHGQVYNVRLTELQNDEASLAGVRAQATVTKNRLSPQIAAAQARGGI